MSDHNDVGNRHAYAPLTEFIAGSRGLPCRSPSCRAIFSRVGDGGSMARLRDAIADRNEHELRRHGAIFTGESAAGHRRRPSVGRHVGELTQ